MATRPRRASACSSRKPCARGQVDFAKFVSVDGKDPQCVSVENEQLCIDGLEHGQRYEVQIRAGLPSDVDEASPRTSRSPSTCPTASRSCASPARATCCRAAASRASRSSPSTPAKVEVEVYRIGDRNLVGAMQSGDFQRQLSELRARNADRAAPARSVFTGELDVADRSSTRKSPTAFPSPTPSARCKPGVYAMIAKPAEVPNEDYSEQATQWFIVSDLGLTAFSGDDGVHAFVRSLASDRRRRGRQRPPRSRATTRCSAPARSDANGYVALRARPSRGRRRPAPALLVAENDTGEYAFLDLTTAPSILPTAASRAARRRARSTASSTPSAASTAPAKRCTSPPSCATARARPPPPRHAHRRAPRRRRARAAITLADQGLGGRDYTPAARRRRDDRHLARQAARRSEGRSAHADLVPRRGLRPRAPRPQARGRRRPRLRPRRRKTIKVIGPLSLRPAGRRPCHRRRHRRQAVEQGSSKATPATSSAQADESIEPVRQPLDERPPPTPRATPSVAITLPPVTADRQAARSQRHRAPARSRRPHHRAHHHVPVDLKQARIGIKPLFKGHRLDEKQTAALRGRHARRRGQARRRQRAQLAARPARHATGSGTAATASGTTRP